TMKGTCVNVDQTPQAAENAGVSANVDAVSTKVDETKSAVDAVSGKVDTLTGKVDAVKTVVDANGGKLDGLATKADTALSDLNAISHKQDALTDGDFTAPSDTPGYTAVHTDGLAGAVGTGDLGDTPLNGFLGSLNLSLGASADDCPSFAMHAPFVGDF